MFSSTWGNGFPNWTKILLKWVAKNHQLEEFLRKHWTLQIVDILKAVRFFDWPKNHPKKNHRTLSFSDWMKEGAYIALMVWQTLSSWNHISIHSVWLRHLCNFPNFIDGWNTNKKLLYTRHPWSCRGIIFLVIINQFFSGIFGWHKFPLCFIPSHPKGMGVPMRPQHREPNDFWSQEKRSMLSLFDLFERVSGPGSVREAKVSMGFEICEVGQIPYGCFQK